MSKPYYNVQHKRWVIAVTDKVTLEFQSQDKAEAYYEKNKGGE